MNKRMSFALLALLLTGCMEDKPRTLAGGTIGAATGGIAGAGLSKAFGASNGMAAGIGLVSALAGGAIGAKVGNNFDKATQAKIRQALDTGRPQSYVTNEGQQIEILPVIRPNMREVSIYDSRTGKLLSTQREEIR